MKNDLLKISWDGNLKTKNSDNKEIKSITTKFDNVILVELKLIMLLL
jgi:hypothetical protein